jgi:peptidoglycan/LPS O-acetylase OafA/YrhL
MDYRRDIDGLRAVAVMLVVLNHAGLQFQGGYVGVDVFFVISGFLITGLIAIQRSRGMFSFRKFYLRRAKRLLPALYLMMLTIMVGGYFFLIPSDYSLLSESALSAVALASNFFFWRSSGGYFSPDAASLPLLHVWSLSLEEQFYLLWPMALLLLLRMRSSKVRSAIIAGVAVLSFAGGEFAVSPHSIGAYFLLPARGGEFMVGTLIYLHWRPGTVNESRGPLLAHVLSSAGSLMILAPAVLLNAKSPFRD